MQFSYGLIMVRFLISPSFRGVALIIRRRLLQGSAYFHLSVERRLLEVRRLLEETRYLIILLKVEPYLQTIIGIVFCYKIRQNYHL